MFKKIIFLTLVLTVICCEQNKALTFNDFVDIHKIESVRMINSSGEFKLSTKQLVRFKKEIALMSYEPNQSVKVGAIHMSLTIDKKEFNIATATHGDFIEIDAGLVTKLKSEFKNPFFKTNGINFDNYKDTNN
jgi:uncharacterized membrane protein